MNKLKKIAAEHWPDAAGIAGAGCISYGAGLVYLPAGWIVAGMLLMAGAWLGSRAA